MFQSQTIRYSEVFYIAFRPNSFIQLYDVYLLLFCTRIQHLLLEQWSHMKSLIIYFLCFDLIAGRNGRGRRLSDQNCWLKLEIIRLYRECSHLRISTTRVYQVPWTARQPPPLLLPCTAVCTGLRQHRIRLSRDRSSPECSFTAWGPGDNRH